MCTRSALQSATWTYFRKIFWSWITCPFKMCFDFWFIKSMWFTYFAIEYDFFSTKRLKEFLKRAYFSDFRHECACIFSKWLKSKYLIFLEGIFYNESKRCICWFYLKIKGLSIFTFNLKITELKLLQCKQITMCNTTILRTIKIASRYSYFKLV